MLALEILALVLPVAILLLVVRRRGRDDASLRGRGLVLLGVTLALGALSFVPAWLVERWIESWAGLDEHARTSDAAALLYAFFVAAPIEQGLKVLAIVPARRSPRFASPADGVLYAAAVGVGFITAHNTELFSRGGADLVDVARALLAAPAHVFFACAWGFVLGRAAAQGDGAGRARIGGTAFDVTWFLAMLFNGVYDHIVFGRTGAALVATAPILLAMGAVSAVTLRSLRPREPGSDRTSRFALAPPSLAAVRAALWRTEQPVMVGWIGLGAFTTVGVIAAALAAAVAVGHRIGVDFAAVDRADGSGSAAPAGAARRGRAPRPSRWPATWCRARRRAAACSEAAIAAALAIAGALVLLGLAAPVAVVFAIAFAPIALGLACAGAWMGVTR